MSQEEERRQGRKKNGGEMNFKVKSKANQGKMFWTGQTDTMGSVITSARVSYTNWSETAEKEANWTVYRKWSTNGWYDKHAPFH